jgi:hypothetical protein
VLFSDPVEVRLVVCILFKKSENREDVNDRHHIKSASEKKSQPGTPEKAFAVGKNF